MVASGRSFSWWVEVKRSALQNFDWEMMTYWAIAGLSHAVLYYRESRDRALRASQLETQLVEAQMAALQQQLQPHPECRQRIAQIPISSSTRSTPSPR